MKQSLLLNVFAGELVEIITDLNVIQSLNLTEDGSMTPGPATPMLINGYVMDCDEVFLYLSTDQENVNQAIPVGVIKHIQISEIKSEFDEMLDEFPEPEDETGYN